MLYKRIISTSTALQPLLQQRSANTLVALSNRCFQTAQTSSIVGNKHREQLVLFQSRYFSQGQQQQQETIKGKNIVSGEQEGETLSARQRHYSNLDLSTVKITNKMPIVKSMKEHFPGLRMSRFPRRSLTKDFEKDILATEQKLINEYGFEKAEIDFIMKYKPSLILSSETEKTGPHIVKKVFVDQKGFPIEYIRTLMVKYPYILSKEEQELQKYFEVLNSHEVSNEQAM